MDKSPIDSWAALHSGASFADLEETKQKATKMEKTVRLRNFFEYVAGAIVIGAAAYSSYHAGLDGEWFVVSAFMTLAAGVLLLMWNLHRLASGIRRKPEQDCTSHIRAQLERQYAALSSVPRWYLAPLVPGSVLIVVAAAEVVARETGWPVAIVGVLPTIAICGAVFGFVAWLNARGARKLKAQIDELDRAV